MKYWTYAEIRDKVENDLGLKQETFITPTEMLGYANAAIDEAESEIHTIYEDYFLTRGTIDIVNGQAGYELPENIYATKLRGVVYKKNTEVYTVHRFKEKVDMFAELEYTNETTTSDYQYILRNDSASLGVKLHLVPASTETLSEGIVVWYLRNANRMIDGDSVCDIPEFVSFVIQYMKVRCYEKEGNSMFQSAVSILEHFRKNMISTLTDMTPDGDNIIEPDLTFYREMEGYNV